jgi:hypothetical protein
VNDVQCVGGVFISFDLTLLDDEFSRTELWTLALPDFSIIKL